MVLKNAYLPLFLIKKLLRVKNIFIRVQHPFYLLLIKTIKGMLHSYRFFKTKNMIYYGFHLSIHE